MKHMICLSSEKLTFRIQFSDNESIRMLNLIQPIIESGKFQGIPKMIISQFCRGTFMNNSIFTMDEFEGPTQFTKSVNSQVNLCYYCMLLYFIYVIKCDLVVLNATASGNPAVRDSRTGESSFIEKLCEELEVRQQRTINQE